MGKLAWENWIGFVLTVSLWTTTTSVIIDILCSLPWLLHLAFLVRSGGGGGGEKENSVGIFLVILLSSQMKGHKRDERWSLNVFTNRNCLRCPRVAMKSSIDDWYVDEITKSVRQRKRKWRTQYPTMMMTVVVVFMVANPNHVDDALHFPTNKQHSSHPLDLINQPASTPTPTYKCVSGWYQIIFSAVVSI